MPNCIVVVQFDLPKRSEEMAVKGGTSTAPTYRGLAKKGLTRKDYPEREKTAPAAFISRTAVNRRKPGLRTRASRQTPF